MSWPSRIPWQAWALGFGISSACALTRLFFLTHWRIFPVSLMIVSSTNFEPPRMPGLKPTTYPPRLRLSMPSSAAANAFARRARASAPHGFDDDLCGDATFHHDVAHRHICLAVFGHRVLEFLGQSRDMVRIRHDLRDCHTLHHSGDEGQLWIHTTSRSSPG